MKFLYQDKTFQFQVSVDSVLNSDSLATHFVIKSISISKLADHKIFQTITPPENILFAISQDKIFVLVDINFDGYSDIKMAQTFPSQSNYLYYYWTYNYQKQQFQIDTTLQNIPSPEFNFDQKTIISYWIAGKSDQVCSVYKYNDGKITLIEEIIVSTSNTDYPGQKVTTKKKLIEGEMKVIETTVEKSYYKNDKN